MSLTEQPLIEEPGLESTMALSSDTRNYTEHSVIEFNECVLYEEKIEDETFLPKTNISDTILKTESPTDIGTAFVEIPITKVEEVSRNEEDNQFSSKAAMERQGNV